MGSNEVLIVLDSKGVGRWDVEIREGWYPGEKPRFSLGLGTDGVGAVAGWEQPGPFRIVQSFDLPIAVGGPGICHRKLHRRKASEPDLT